MTTVVIGALVALGMVQQTDTTFPLEGRELLSVDATGGSIVVQVWDRDEVRVQGEHSSRTYIEIDTRRNQIDVESEARRGPAHIVDYQITVPRSLNLELDGMYTDITVEGADGEVEAETLQGDITIRGGRGSVNASSATGLITVEGAEGRIEIESAGSDIHITGSSGELLAESAGGNIVLESVQATSVDVGSVGGRIYFDGSFEPSGTYFFGTHGGSITIVVPETVAATFNVASVHGTITSNLTGSPSSFERGQRHQFDVNGGGALVEAETYGGRIQIMRKGTEGTPPLPRDGRGERDLGEPEGRWHGDLPGPRRDVAVHANGTLPAVQIAVGQALARVQPRIDVAVETAVGAALGGRYVIRNGRLPATIRR